MMLVLWGCYLLSFLWSQSLLAEAKDSKLSNQYDLHSESFIPPKVFRQSNLVRNIQLEKVYARETISVTIENIDKAEQYDYFLPFDTEIISRIGGFEAGDKDQLEKGLFQHEIIGNDSFSAVQYVRIQFSEPLKPKEQQTLSISYYALSAFNPRPALIEQTDKQYVEYSFNVYACSAYETSKQRTKLKLPNAEVSDYTILPKKNAEKKEDPQRQGSTFNYGPYDKVPAGSIDRAALNFEFTKPLIHATLLERDIEVSHWGGNLAIEERYWLKNRGAQLKNHFSRVDWVLTQYYSPATSAIKELKIPLRAGTLSPYFVDDIGNVSTSRFSASARDANLELKPRYPVFGGWKYNFKIGWNENLRNSLRKLKIGQGYALLVPFLEGPKQAEGIEYELVQLRVVLPEGARNIRYETTVPVDSSSISLHHTFLDTVGRSMLTINASNIVDDFRSRNIVVYYEYSWTAGLRKPLTIFCALFSVFVAAWAFSKVDTRIGHSAKVK